MNFCKKIFLSFVFIFICNIAEARIYIPVDQPSDQKFPIAICNLKGSNELASTIPDIIRNDLDLSGYFNIIPQSIFEGVAKNEGLELDSIKYDFWTAIETQALVKGQIETEGDHYVITLRLFDPYLQEMVVGKQYTFPKKNKKNNIREVAHRFSDDIMEALTGIRGVFNTKIAYAAVTKKGKKEIFVMDMDGENNGSVTSLNSISISPAWSPDGGKLAFTSYIKNNPDLYVIDVSGKGLKQIVGGSGSKITPAWSPNGSTIAFSSSMGGSDNEIYSINASGGGKASKLTNASGINIAPGFSPDGSEFVFSSERAGNLHVFKMPAGGGGATRLTFVGYQNDMPDWSPIGDKIAFAGRDMGTFDIFIMNPDGSNIQRLTIGSGSNEHPSWSPDGRFIVFSSSREGGPAIYLMRADGSNQRKISKGNGILPEWGPAVK